MGWTTEYRPQGSSHLDWFAMKYDGPQGKVIDAATLGSTCYMAYRFQDDAGEEHVSAMVALIRWHTGQDLNFSYKLIEETMGPGERRCPERILKQLTPLEDMDLHPRGMKWAKEWRKDCQNRLDRKRLRGKVSRGDHVCFRYPIRFTDGIEAERFEWIRGNSFYRLQRSEGAWRREGLVSIRSWRDRDWARVNA